MGNLGDYLEKIEEAAWTGNVQAAGCMAMIYGHGLVGEKNLAKALEWINWEQHFRAECGEELADELRELKSQCCKAITCPD